eukprot:COSAG01_NODE_2227_length_8132_cov_3.231420_10_plen_463_part_00
MEPRSSICIHKHLFLSLIPTCAARRTQTHTSDTHALLPTSANLVAVAQQQRGRAQPAMQLLLRPRGAPSGASLHYNGPAVVVLLRMSTSAAVAALGTPPAGVGPQPASSSVAAAAAAAREPESDEPELLASQDAEQPTQGYTSSFHLGTQDLWLDSTSSHRGFSCSSCGVTPIVGDRHVASRRDARGRQLSFCDDCMKGSWAGANFKGMTIFTPRTLARDYGPFEVVGSREDARAGDCDGLLGEALSPVTPTLSQLQWAVLRLVFAASSHIRLGARAWTVGADIDVVALVGERLLCVAEARVPGLVWKAAKSGDAAQVVQLLDLGADVNDANSADAMNPTPLFVAARLGRLAVVEALLRRSADVTTQNCRACQCLMVAAQNGHTATVERLLQTKAVDIDLPNYQSSTPLTMAAQNGHMDAVRLLVLAGADKTHRCSLEGYTAAQWASTMGHQEIVAFLGGAV